MELTNEVELELKKKIKEANLRHIAIIMDGNRRWAKKYMLPSVMGHKKGVDALKKTTKECNDLGIKYLTLYAFLMDLLATTLKNELDELNQNNVKMNYIGNLARLNPSLREIINFSKEKTKNNTGVVLTVAINYGARDEIVNAIKNIINDGIKKEDINEQLVSKYLYTNTLPDPDLLIRTSGEKRISNYLLWQIAYSEIYITNIFWPEFDKEALKDAVIDFLKRQRRWGK